MTKSKKIYKNNSKTVQDDFVEGDTVSEGDTSDDEDIEGSKIKNTRRVSLELPSGSADDTTHPSSKRRKIFVALAVVALFATTAAIGGGILFSRKESTPQTPSTTLEQESAESPLTQPEEEDENDSIPDSDANLGLLLDQMVDAMETVPPRREPVDTGVTTKFEDEEADIEEEKKAQDKESRPTTWPSLVGMTGNEAKKQLELLYGEEIYDIYILHENDPVTRDYRFNRIRIFTNDEGIVTTVPHIG